jgi:tetratricopeptide (TPR) repeat protein
MRKIFAAAFVLAAAAALFAQKPDALQNYRIGRDLEARSRWDEANGYYAEAVRICQDELSRNAANMDSYTVLTWALLRQRRYSEVISWGQRALQYNANDLRIVETMGEAYFHLNDYPHSLQAMQKYTDAIPRSDRASTAFFFMGEVFRNQGKFRRADIAYTTAVALDASSALWWFRLGYVREQAGEAAGAVAAYEKAVALNSGYRDALIGQSAGEALERARKLAATAAVN